MSKDNPTKADAHRWLAYHEGHIIATVQTDGDYTWKPQDRTLSRQFNESWLLDGSMVRITKEHKVLTCGDSTLVLAWNDENGRLIHITTYTVVLP